MPGPDPYASMPHRHDCGRGPHCECDPPDSDEYDEPNDGYDFDVIYEAVANAEMQRRFHKPSMVEWLESEAERAVISETRAKGIVVPEEYEPASPRYAIAYWLAALQSELLCAELCAADCMDDADDLLADLAAVGLTVVRTVCPEPECRGGWVWVDIDDGESIRQRCPRNCDEGRVPIPKAPTP